MRSSPASRSRSPRDSVPSSTASASTRRVIAASTRILPVVGEGDQDAAPVVRVGFAPHERAVDEPVDAIGHRAARDERLLQQLLRAELERLARAAEGRQHVPLPRLEVAATERVAPRAVEVTREPVDARQHPSGEKSRSGRCAVQACTMRSTSSASFTMAPLSRAPVDAGAALEPGCAAWQT